ncbi:MULTISPECIES: O-antigen ligase family protein [unclassified Photobacterium]|uniref:O-antigen ligase family protein n=1 Tax=unclassified Photobacterium TaxID=2628852 RepID=UPI000D17A0EC|nr:MULTISPECIES: O-antigen ligase family protein [unclassified Photobacterium]PSV23000.1 oligosaccharide repeat unit polymerase [Photobacterium sp. GB-56]PSV26794.1 oligosaccharide repeat unit polymerase [Photobacterium sp. GB-72]PSV52268.1 oligosaccharide repeat unit polymerase [Photobacterium sp. GB-3]
MTRGKQIIIALFSTISCFIVSNYTFKHYFAFLGILSLPFVVKRAFLLCIWFILFSYFRLHEAMPFLEPFKIPKLLALACLVGLSWQLWMNYRNFKWHPLHTWLLCFAFWVSISCAFASNREESFEMLSGNFLKIVLMVFAISLLPTHISQLKRIPYLLFLCGLLIASITLYNKYYEIGLVEETRVTIGRAFGSMLGDPNDLSLVLLFPLSFTAVYIFHGHIIARLIAMLISITLLAGIAATESRGGQLGIISVVFMSLLLRSKNIVTPLIITALGIMALFVAAGIENRFVSSASSGAIDESAMGRLYAWGAAIMMAVDHPFTGVGLSNFYNNYYFYSVHWDGKNHAVHSSWFEILAENGFVGLFLFATLLIKTFQLSYRLLKRLKKTTYQPLAEGLWLGMVSFSVSGTFLTQGTTWPFYILLSLLIATDRLTCNTNQLHKKDLSHGS